MHVLQVIITYSGEAVGFSHITMYHALKLCLDTWAVGKQLRALYMYTAVTDMLAKAHASVGQCCTAGP
jgi:hypothetical protein